MAWSTIVIAELLLVLIQTGDASSVRNSGPYVIEQEFDIQLRVRRFLHGCPFAFPCALPPCENPVFGPHDCCGSCPDPEPEGTTKSPAKIASSNEESKRTLIQDGTADRHRLFKKNLVDKLLANRMTFTMPTTTMPTTTSECPYPCTYNGLMYCHPFPCHITCVDSIRPSGSCCEVCPNGPNCHYNGHIIPEGKNATFGNGVTVFCANGDIYGGNLQIYQPVG